MTEPRIVAAAIRLESGEVVSLPAPARHHTIIRHLHGLGTQSADLDTQGFVTDDGRFVHRRAALRIARDAEQMIRQTHPTQLFSEDLW